MKERLYIIESASDILIQKEIQNITKKIKNEIEIIKYDLQVATIDDVIEALDTYDMFLKQKVIICTNPTFLEEKVGDEFNLKKFLKYLENPSDNILILITNKINNRLKTTSSLIKYFKLIKVKDESVESFIKDNLEDYKMDIKTIKYFIDKVGHDFQVIKEELLKLKSYKEDTKTILIEDIDLVSNKNQEGTIFDLIEAIIKKDKKKSYELYNYFLENGTEIFQILVLLSNQIRLIYNVKVLFKHSDYEISEILQVKEYPVKLARNKSYSYSKEELLNLLFCLAKLDYDIKSGKALPNISFLTFIMQM